MTSLGFANVLFFKTFFFMDFFLDFIILQFDSWSLTIIIIFSSLSIMLSHQFVSLFKIQG